MTVFYGLTTEDANTVEEVIAGFGPVKIDFGETMYFTPSKGDCDVVVLEIDSPDLIRLHDLIASRLEYHSDYTTYIPHLTIAYVHRGRGQDYDDLPVRITGQSIVMDEVVFSARPNGVKTPISLKRS